MKELLVMLLAILLSGCSSFASVGLVDLPDGSKLKAMKYHSDTVHGTDINYVIVYHCPESGDCLKAGEFGGSSGAFLKSMFGGAAAGAAIGAGIALQSPDTTSISQSQEVKGVSAAKATGVGIGISSSKATAVSKSKAFQIQGQGQGQGQSQFQGQQQGQIQGQQQKGIVKGGAGH